MSQNPLIRQSLQTSQRNQMIDITDRISAAVRQNNVLDGYVIVHVPHTTAAVTINENADPDVRHDLLAKLESVIPKSESYYQHAEGNSDSHLKASLVGNSVTVIIDSGKLVLGRWQGIYFCEFDGPRQRDLVLKIVDLRPARS